jgi:hypothetical protein
MGARNFSFPVSINRLYPGEKLGPPTTDKRWFSFNASFRNETHTPASLLAEIKNGHAFCCFLGACSKPDCDRPYGHRLNRHFVSANHIGLDFDSGDHHSTFECLLRDDFLSRHSAFLYTTLSHTPQVPKCRVVLVVDTPFTDADYYRRAKVALLAKYPSSDPTVKDPARFLYGSRPKGGESIFLGNPLPMSLVNQLTDEYQQILEHQATRRDMPAVDRSQVKGDTAAERYVSAAIAGEVQWLASRQEGTGERHLGLLVAAMKLQSLKLSDWLAPALRSSIEPYSCLLPAAQANGYVAKYGEPAARRTIAGGIAYAKTRSQPEYWGSNPQPKVLHDVLAHHLKGNEGATFPEKSGGVSQIMRVEVG